MAKRILEDIFYEDFGPAKEGPPGGPTYIRIKPNRSKTMGLPARAGNILSSFMNTPEKLLQINKDNRESAKHINVQKPAMRMIKQFKNLAKDRDQLQEFLESTEWLKGKEDLMFGSHFFKICYCERPEDDFAPEICMYGFKISGGEVNLITNDLMYSSSFDDHSQFLLALFGVDDNDLNNMLHTLLINLSDNIESVKKIISLLNITGGDINSPDEHGKTIIMYNSAYSYNILELLIRNSEGIDINTKDNNGRTALMHAVLSGNIETVRLLIRKGSWVNAKDNNGKTALMFSIDSGVEDITELLLKNRADVNYTDKDGVTVLMHAIIDENRDIAAMLINHGADVNIIDKDRETALSYAYAYDMADIVQLLIRYGARHSFNTCGHDSTYFCEYCLDNKLFCEDCLRVHFANKIHHV